VATRWCQFVSSEAVPVTETKVVPFPKYATGRLELFSQIE
jgi:hypothetical protein